LEETGILSGGAEGFLRTNDKQLYEYWMKQRQGKK